MTANDYPISEDIEEDIGFKIAAKLGRVMEDYGADEGDELELYGINPRVIGIFMILVTIFLPVGIVYVGYNFLTIPAYIYSGFWIIGGGQNFWFVFDPTQLIGTFWFSLPLCTFNFLYIRQINRFFQGETSRDIALMFGLMSAIIPSAVTLALWSSGGFPFIIIPIPIQFFVGVILIYKFREPEVISPWEGLFLDWSWWTRQRHSLHSSDQKVINLSKLLREHEADWLEGFDE